jgi:hypothetical protein
MAAIIGARQHAAAGKPLYLVGRGKSHYGEQSFDYIQREVYWSDASLSLR